MRSRWLGSGLRAKLLVAHLLLIAVGTTTFLLAAGLLAPNLFHAHFNQMIEMGTSGAGAGVGAQKADAELRAAFQATVNQAVLVATAAGGLAAIVASLFISDRIAEPVKRMAAAAGRIAAGRYTERVRIDAVDPVFELAQLAQSFNEMAGSLEATERRRTELLSDVAHELRTPIATLEGYLEGLLDGLVEPSPETWARLHDEAGRLRRLVDDLQDLSRAEARQLSLKLESVDPAGIAQASLDSLRLNFDENGLELTTHTPGNLPCVSADCDRAVQVLTNLLTNALRYTPAPGRVALSLTLCPGGKAILFEVADTGAGIAPEHLPRLFERFYRVDKSRSRAAGGSGIGLTVAKAMVEAMGGRIWARSGGLGQGSTFSFTLPVVGMSADGAQRSPDLAVHLPS